MSQANNLGYTSRYYFYFLIILFFIFFIFIFFLLELDINLTFITNFFSKESVDIESYIYYLEGDVYLIKESFKEFAKYNTKITNSITIETGKNSFFSFYIKRQGIYYIYPESTVYIDKIENLNKEKSVKETHIIIEKGKVFFDLNLFTDNSVITVETDTIFLIINKGKILVDKIDNFKTDVFSFGGKVYFRPFSNKFELLKTKRIYGITDSLERLISYNNILYKDEKVSIDYEECKKFDILLSRIYESRNLNLNKEYIMNNLLFNKEYFFNDYDIPLINIDEGILDNYGYLELVIPNIKYSVFFDGKELRSNTRYIFLLKNGHYKIDSYLSWTYLSEYLDIKNNELTYIYLNNYSGVKDILINNKRTNFLILSSEEMDKNFRFLYKKSNNFQLIKLENLGDVIYNFIIRGDLPIKRLYFFKNNIINSSEYILENNEKKYYSFPVEIYGKEILIDNIDFDFSKDIILIEYESKYNLKY